MAKVFTKREFELVADNLRAFTANFGDARIEKADYGKGFYVYYPTESNSWIQFCYDINYLNGWLYGVVQGVVRGEFKKAKAEREEC